MYSGVPTTIPLCVCGVWLLPGSPTLASPKSSSFTYFPPDSSTTKMLFGFRSRWTTPAWWAAWSADATSSQRRHRLLGREGAVLLDVDVERLAAQVLHDEVLPPVGELPEAEDVDDPAVMRRVHRPRLGQQPLEVAGAGGDLRAQHLDRHRLADERLHPAVDEPHSAHADELLHAVLAEVGANHRIAHQRRPVAAGNLGRLRGGGGVADLRDRRVERLVRAQQRPVVRAGAHRREDLSPARGARNGGVVVCQGAGTVPDEAPGLSYCGRRMSVCTPGRWPAAEWWRLGIAGMRVECPPGQYGSRAPASCCAGR